MYLFRWGLEIFDGYLKELLHFENDLITFYQLVWMLLEHLGVLKEFSVKSHEQYNKTVD